MERADVDTSNGRLSTFKRKLSRDLVLVPLDFGAVVKPAEVDAGIVVVASFERRLSRRGLMILLSFRVVAKDAGATSVLRSLAILLDLGAAVDGVGTDTSTALRRMLERRLSRGLARAPLAFGAAVNRAGVGRTSVLLAPIEREISRRPSTTLLDLRLDLEAAGGNIAVVLRTPRSWCRVLGTTSPRTSFPSSDSSSDVSSSVAK